jgi:hypothetical protein
VIFWIPAIVLLLVLLLVRLLAAGRRLGEARTVLLHLPCEKAWEEVRDFPALHAAHARGRPHLVIEQSVLRGGSGQGSGTVWRQEGWWGGQAYWAELEVTHWDPPHRLTVRLLRDSLATERGLLGHRGELTLVPEGPAVTKLTWRLSARIGVARLLLARLLWPERMRARLLDLGLRSVKRAIDGGARKAGRAAGDAAPIAPVFVPSPGARDHGAQAPPPSLHPRRGLHDQP